MKLIMEGWRKFIQEGGNVFGGQTASIPREYIEPTLDKYREELGRLFPKKKEVFNSFRYLGSVGKKPMSGDIDLAIDANELFEGGEVTPDQLEKWGIDPDQWQKTFDLFKKRSRTRTDAEIGWRSFLMELAKRFNKDSRMIISNLKKIAPGTMFSLFPQFNEKGEQQDIGVQIDWMVGNVEWLEFAYWSAPPHEEEQYLKGLHRTQLMLSMFSVKGMSYIHTIGIRDKETRELITDSPKEALKILGELYDGEISNENISDFYTLHDWLRENASKKDYNAAIGTYLKILDSTKSVKIGDSHCGYIPRDLEDTWIEKQNELELSGKFICKDTNEKIWNHIYSEQGQ